ncbi:MAG: GGDEF domain-containing protein [Rhizobiales bacterium]|nr:GGDEF domain-containing protein [Hyphomicrobiales bacterium]
MERLAREVEALRADLLTAHERIRELEARADIDGLLDLLNRRGFERELDRALSFRRRYGMAAALIYIDFDRFKPINDLYGHAAGDEVLRAAARALVGAVRASDVVGRLGGDELAVLLWNATPQHAAAKALKLEAEIAATGVEWDGRHLSVAASAGMTMLEQDDDPASVIARADRAMYARKAAKAGVT